MTPADDRALDQLFGCRNHSLVFAGDSGAVPWPQWDGRPRAPKQQAAMRALLARPPVLFEIDPRLLLATQPRVIRHHFFFYRSRPSYELFGRTSADHDSELNRFPVMEPTDDGRFVLRSGHHRALHALLSGSPLKCRVVSRPMAREPVAVTPRLRVQPHRAPTSSFSTARALAASMLSGETAIARSPSEAQQVLADLRCDPRWAVELLRRSFPTTLLKPIPVSDDSEVRTWAKHRAWATPTFCVICGERSTTVAVAGFSACTAHAEFDRPESPLYRWYDGRPL